MKRKFSKVALLVIALVLVFAVVSFLRENWSAADRPGVIETFLARMVLSQARSAGSDVKNPLPATPENIEAGRQIYEKQCAFCHGLDGQGQRETGIQFYPPVPSLVDETPEMTDGQIQYITSQGIRYTAMPSFAKELTQEEIWKVVLWVRRLSQQPASALSGKGQGPDSR